MASAEPARGWVLYDGACGFCRWWVPFWAETLRPRGFAIAPLQASWVKATLPQLVESERIGDLRLLLADGSQVSGADVYRHVMRRIWWAYPFYGLSVAPVLSGIFDGAYRTFARNRYRVSRACRLPESLASAPPRLPDGQGSETDDPGCRTPG